MNPTIWHAKINFKNLQKVVAKKLRQKFVTEMLNKEEAGVEYTIWHAKIIANAKKSTKVC